MRKAPWIIVVTVLILGFAAFSCVYTVRFTESAVVTTFGRASADSVVTEPGLKLKLPTPFSSVTKYDTRSRFMEPAGETFSTADDVQLVVQGFFTWHVEDPLRFYQRHRGGAGSSTAEHYREAEKYLQSSFRSALAEVSNFSRDELFAPGDSKLVDLEEDIIRRLTASADEEGFDVADYGIGIDLVGITSIELPQQVTSQVFALMQSERQKVAASAEGEGEALAASIRAQGRTDAQRILAFADLRASALRSRGENEAARWLAEQNKNPELAEFLQKLELMRQGLGTRSTFVVGTDVFGFDVFSPLAPQTFGRDQMPASRAGSSNGGTE